MPAASASAPQSPLIRSARDAQAKRAEGNEAYKACNFVRAIELYSEAIKLDDGDHLAYGNRANAALRAGNLAKVLEDAELCNQIAPREYVKHLTIRASALRLQGQKTEARAVLQSVLDRVPGHPTATGMLAEIGEVGPEHDEAPPAPSAAGAFASALSGTGVEAALTLARAVLLAASVTYMCGGLLVDARLGDLAYLVALGGATVLNLVHSLRGAMHRSGGFSLTSSFAQALVSEPSTPLVLLGTTFLQSRPVFIVLWPMLCYEVMRLGTAVEAAVPPAAGPLRWVANTIMARAADNEGFAAIAGAEARMAAAHPFLASSSAQAQLMLLGLLIVELLFPTRTILGLVLHGQNVMMQYAVSPAMKAAVDRLHASMSGLAHHPSAPAMVGKAYDAAAGAVASFADLRRNAEAAQASAAAGGGAGGGGGGGLMSSCAVM